MVDARVNVLISSAGRRVSLLRSFRQAIQDSEGISGRVLASDASPLSAASWDADERFVSPKCNEPDFVPFLIEKCRDHEIGLLVPTIDTELRVLSENRDLFEAIGTRVLISDPEVVEIASDKVLTNEFFVRHDLPTVRQESARNFKMDVSGLAAPFIAKPRRGSASLGVRTVSTHSEISSLPDYYVIEEHAPGHEYTMDVFLDGKGEAEVVVPRRRIETRAGEVSKGVTCHVPALEGAAAAVCHELPGAVGVLTIQGFYDSSSGRVSLIEINPRFGGGYPLSHAAGANFPLWLVRASAGLPVRDFEKQWEEGLTMLRFDDAIFVSSTSGIA